MGDTQSQVATEEESEEDLKAIARERARSSAQRESAPFPPLPEAPAISHVSRKKQRHPQQQRQQQPLNQRQARSPALEAIGLFCNYCYSPRPPRVAPPLHEQLTLMLASEVLSSFAFAVCNHRGASLIYGAALALQPPRKATFRCLIFDHLSLWAKMRNAKLIARHRS
ncbi:hypothetical protein TKK_0015805 [Trichogramma kaykai]